MDGTGAVVKAGARGLLGLAELDTVIAKGNAKRDEAGNLSIIATAVFVKK